MKQFSSWGRLGAFPHQAVALDTPSSIAAILRESKKPGIAYGMGRSYGDICLNPGGTLWVTAGLDHFIAFDPVLGHLHCEAGVLLEDIQRVLIPQGWILPVTPGTQLVTVGGAIANDVHGKNHHKLGSFGHHILRLSLIRTDGDVIECGPDLRPEWFAATVGGMGLTGIIADAKIQLRPVDSPWLETETCPFSGLDAFFALSDESEAKWEHTVAWIDCISGGGGRGIFMRGNYKKEGGGRNEPVGKTLTMPLVPPVSLVNQLSLRLFNTAYYHLNKWRAGQKISHYRPFFYPLDNVLEWNRMYGPRGFFQYQSVVPREVGKEAVSEMLKEISASGEGSFLAVLKVFGGQSPAGLMSFPAPGVTLALDFPNCGERTSRLFERLDAIVRQAKGRLYPAKDARMPRDLFESGYPGLPEFLSYRDPGISSALSRRLVGV